MPKLKVFCTTSGFYDHVVAAPSRPAALKAWGAKTDLFSMGVARLVTNPKIEKKALERPGEVVRLKRDGGSEVVSPRARRKPAIKRPSRAKLDAAKNQLAELERRQKRESGTARRAAIAAEKKLEALEKRQATERRAAERKLDEAREEYDAALSEWDVSSEG
jgi:hypothetical protein